MLKIDHIRIGSLPPFSFTVAAGECMSVEGPSGSGKTRLLRAIADLDAASGQVFIDGAERREIPATRWRKLVRYVSAEPAWWAPTARAHMGSEPHAGRLRDLMSSLALDPALLDRPISELSTGERQRLALVRAMLDEPRVLLLDEPTAALDPHNAVLVDDVIRSEVLAGRIVVLVSHNPLEVERLAHARLLLGPASEPGPRPEPAIE